MNPFLLKLQVALGGQNKNLQVMAAPIAVVAVLALMVLPLPPFMLDLFFTFNIATALMVMMVAATMLRPLDFAAFPQVLLLTTLLRLSLNVASTRIVLMQGHTGAVVALGAVAGPLERELARVHRGREGEVLPLAHRGVARGLA